MAHGGQYRTKNGRHRFGFRIEKSGDHYEVHSTSRPSLNGKDSDSHKTHLHRDGRVCFHKGKEPKSVPEAEKRAAEWAEHYADYRD